MMGRCLLLQKTNCMVWTAPALEQQQVMLEPVCIIISVVQPTVEPWNLHRRKGEDLYDSPRGVRFLTWSCQALNGRRPLLWEQLTCRAKRAAITYFCLIEKIRP
jgi:hypothetical protein